uniref:Uncharacterized protein n=1 Tax=Parascaris univalens TaxID=6257 RepID=A0A915CDX0_PARUN
MRGMIREAEPVFEPAVQSGREWSNERAALAQTVRSGSALHGEKDTEWGSSGKSAGHRLCGQRGEKSRRGLALSGGGASSGFANAGCKSMGLRPHLGRLAVMWIVIMVGLRVVIVFGPTREASDSMMQRPEASSQALNDSPKSGKWESGFAAAQNGRDLRHTGLYVFMALIILSNFSH